MRSDSLCTNLKNDLYVERSSIVKFMFNSWYNVRSYSLVSVCVSLDFSTITLSPVVKLFVKLLLLINFIIDVFGRTRIHVSVKRYHKVLILCHHTIFFLS